LLVSQLRPDRSNRVPRSRDHVRPRQLSARIDEVGANNNSLLRIHTRLRVFVEGVLYEFTVEDPTMYSQAWGGEIPFKKFGAMLYEYACHEGNYSMMSVVSGARYQEGLEAQESSGARRD